MQLKNRDWLVRVAGMQFAGLAVEFEIEKSVRPEPNKCTLTVYNLNASSRATLEELNLYDPKKVKGAPRPRGNVAASAPKAVAKLGKIRVEIEAGYMGSRGLVFRGDLRRAISTKRGADWVTRIEGEDGGDSALLGRVSETFPAGTPKVVVVKRCAEALGLGMGNVHEVMDLLGGTYSHGTVLDGSAADELKGILRRCGLTYSIQHGVVQYRRTGRGVGDKVQAILLSKESGMIEAPQRDATGELIVKCMMIPNVTPGGYVLVKAINHSGVYQIVSVKTSGHSSGDEWGHELSLLPG